MLTYHQYHANTLQHGMKIAKVTKSYKKLANYVFLGVSRVTNS